MARYQHQRRRRCPPFAFLVAINFARSGTSFAPPLSAKHVASAAPSTRGVTCSRLTLRCFRATSSALWGVEAAAADDDAGTDDDDEIDRLVGIDEFRAEQAERAAKAEKADAERAAAAVAAAVAAAGVGTGAGLGLEGAIFPSDAFPGSPATEDITLQGTKLEKGQPEAMIGFWKLYGSTADGEDLSGRIILRADGQVVGGPTVRTTPGVKWSDPEGLKPVGGRWSVYSDKRKGGQSRLQFSIILSFQKKQQLEMDGVVLMVAGIDEIESEGRGGGLESAGDPRPQVFGGVRKRNGVAVEPGEGDFSMMKVPAGEDKLVATVGSQQKRIW